MNAFEKMDLEMELSFQTFKARTLEIAFIIFISVCFVLSFFVGRQNLLLKETIEAQTQTVNKLNVEKSVLIEAKGCK